jgi:dTDP-4-dehydrorhamnose 3,5-epimerase
LLVLSRTKLKDVAVITPERYGDDRGFFSESWNRQAMSDVGLDLDFVQDNHSISRQAGTLRGLHFQVPPHAQTKLVRCSRGRLLDIAVDLRTGSSTFRQWVAVELSFKNGKQLLIPQGFAHGFVTLEPDTEVSYKCSDYYAPEADRSIAFDEPAFNIDWGIDRSAAVLSTKDAEAPLLDDVGNPF